MARWASIVWLCQRRGQRAPHSLARIEFLGEIPAGRVIFGDPDCEPLLAVTAPESAGIVIDPANKTLKRLPAIPLK
ncbi:MAG: hypothetical protein JW955_14960 [Sedimentisphaerales bacterium]|nr:hypothetical protein [Sedimentisphaerales bacterium]